MKSVTPPRRLPLLRGVALLVIGMAGLIANLGLPPAARAASSLSYYASTAGSNDVTYHGHQVILNPNVFLIFEGSWATIDMQMVKQYFTDVSGSPFEGILTQYYDTDANGTKHYISNSITVAGSAMDPNFFHYDPCATQNAIVDPGVVTNSPSDDIYNEIKSEIAANKWNWDPNNSIFFVLTPPGYTVLWGDGLTGGCSTTECGYHNRFTTNSGITNLIYAVISWGGTCNNGSPPSDFPSGTDPVQIDINTASHEQFEAITNPTLSVSQLSGGGWYNNDCGSGIGSACEIGDKCAGVHPGIELNGHSYPVVQGEYSKAAHDSQLGDCGYLAMPFQVYDVYAGGNFYTLWEQMRGGFGSLGEPINNWYATSGGEAQNFGGGGIYWSSATGTDEVQGGIYSAYVNVWGGPAGGLNFPTSDELGIASGRVSYFYGNLCGARGPDHSGAAIYWTSTTGAHQVGGCIYNHYWSVLGGPAGDGYHNLGFPTSDVLAISGGYVSYFYGVRCGGVAHGPDNSGSALYYSGGTGAHEVQGCTYAAYQRLGGPTGSAGLGYPVSDENKITNSSGSLVGWVSYFQGHPCNSSSHPYGSGSAIYVPSSNATASGGFMVRGCIYDTYLAYGGPTGRLGFPVTDEYTNSAGEPESDFQGGKIIWTASGASVTFYPCGAAALCPTP